MHAKVDLYVYITHHYYIYQEDYLVSAMYQSKPCMHMQGNV